MSGHVSLRWLGVAGVELCAHDQVLLIDPFLTRPPFRYLLAGRMPSNAALVAQVLPRADYILVSHAHWDHLMDVPELARRTGALVVGSPNTCQLSALCGVASEQMQRIAVGDTLTLGAFRVEVHASEHGLAPGLPGPGPLAPNLRPPLRLRDYRLDSCLGFLVDVDGYRVSFAPGPARPANLLLVSMQNSRAYYEKLLREAQPEIVVPIHWDHLFSPLSSPPRQLIPPGGRDLARFQRCIGTISPHARVLILEPLRRYDLP